uniref:(California timema) hypothetical protein n=1 Tax=Timema californicum TaxID=61474 RepID=A0A7R9PAZ1_TIMCA|nr:unnamed protein product [Timema californicum]
MVAFKKKSLGKPTTAAPKSPMDEMLEEKYKICKDKEGNTPDETDAINLKKKGGIPTSAGGKCLAECMMMEGGLLDSEGQFSPKGCQELVKKMAPHMAGPASDFYINECNKKIGKVPGKCEAPPKVISCFSMMKAHLFVNRGFRKP